MLARTSETEHRTRIFPTSTNFNTGPQHKRLPPHTINSSTQCLSPHMHVNKHGNLAENTCYLSTPGNPRRHPESPSTHAMKTLGQHVLLLLDVCCCCWCPERTQGQHPRLFLGACCRCSCPKKPRQHLLVLSSICCCSCPENTRATSATIAGHLLLLHLP